MRILVRVLLATVLAVCVACTTRLTDFTMISTKNVELSQAKDFRRGGKRVEGRDIIHIIIFIPTGVPNLKQAIDRAIESVPGAVALVDGVVKQTGWYIPLLYGQQGWVVEGTPLIDPRLVSQMKDPVFYIVRMNSAGGVDESRSVGAAEYESARLRTMQWAR